MKWDTLKWLAGIIAIQILSAAVIFHPDLNTYCAIVIALAIGLLAIYRPGIALAVLATEFIIGSLGGLFKIGANAVNDGGVSIRVLIFIAFMLGWLVWAIRNRTYRVWRTYLNGRLIYLVLVVAVFYALIVGWINHNPFIYSDANAWGVWLLLLPVLDIVKHRRQEIERWIMPAVIAALGWMVCETFAVFYFFSHGFSHDWTEPVYLWLRRTRVGEVTPTSGYASRVFFQSHIYAVIAFIGGLVFWARSERSKTSHEGLKLLIMTAFFCVVVISLSRSLTVGLIVGIFVTTLFLLRRKSWLLNLVRNLLASVIGALVLVSVVLWLPFPHSGGSLFDLMSKRADVTESAAVSRWQLIPVMWQAITDRPVLGYGFGATLTYETKDPRAVALNGGRETTYAFEWGWLDIWFKFGILGLLVLIGLLIDLVRRISRSNLNESTKVALISCLAALSAIHFFTPYLNHPLGFAILIAMEGMIENRRYA